VRFSAVFLGAARALRAQKRAAALRAAALFLGWPLSYLKRDINFVRMVFFDENMGYVGVPL
jgi:hypothetical protein